MVLYCGSDTAGAIGQASQGWVEGDRRCGDGERKPCRVACEMETPLSCSSFPITNLVSRNERRTRRRETLTTGGGYPAVFILVANVL